LSEFDGPWFPIIFSDKCDGCAKIGKPRCVEFCPNGVFMFQDGKAVVAYQLSVGVDAVKFIVQRVNRYVTRGL